jgi:hypothetical protein
MRTFAITLLVATFSGGSARAQSEAEREHLYRLAGRDLVIGDLSRSRIVAGLRDAIHRSVTLR